MRTVNYFYQFWSCPLLMAWHGGPWGNFLSCQAEISSLPLFLLSTVQKPCVSTGKMPNIFWKSSGVGLQLPSCHADGSGSLRDAALTIATPLCFMLCQVWECLCCLDGGRLMERGDGLFLTVSPVMLGWVTQEPVALQPEGASGDPVGDVLQLIHEMTASRQTQTLLRRVC